jgi:C4-dicarboxylate-specific signal transduction histidine kinase
MTMGEMVSSISHEINQPLGSIANYGNAARRLLAAEPKRLQEVDQALAHMVTEAERASAVISRIRALSRKSRAERVPLCIEEMIGEVLALANRELLSRQVVVRTEFAEDLPLVQGDRIELQQVLLNLVMNAAEAMSSSDGSRHLVICAGRSAPEPHAFVRVSVRDSGIGFRPEELERIFTAFYTTKSQGMGLGLAISRTIVEALGGRLWAEVNNDGPGATFHFTVPAAT